jgi:hypothetical protein
MAKGFLIKVSVAGMFGIRKESGMVELITGHVRDVNIVSGHPLFLRR